LELKAFNCVIACDGQEALEKVEAERPDLILLDVEMPRMDGYTFIRHLRRLKTCRDIPVIVITGYPNGDLRSFAAEKGAVDFLEKPFPPEALLESIGRFL